MQYVVIDKRCGHCADFIEDWKAQHGRSPRVIEYDKNKAFLTAIKVEGVPAIVDIKRHGKGLAVCIDEGGKQRCTSTKKKYKIKVGR